MPFDWNDADQWAVRLAGVAGALVSMRFVDGSVRERIVMAVGGALFSYYTAAFVSAKLGIPEGLAGFLLGLFGMSVLSRIWDWLQTASATAVLKRFILGFLNIPPK